MPACATPPQADLFASAEPALHSLFFALQPDPQTAARIAESTARLRTAHPGSRWIKPSRYHVTLHYLGQSPGRREDHIQQAIAAAQGLQSPGVSLQLERLQALGNPGNPALALVSEAVPQGLQQLWLQLAERLLRQGFRLGQRQWRTFVPHLTLAYTPPQPPLTAVTPQQLYFDAFVLLSSVYQQPEHELLGRWPLMPTNTAA